MFYLGGKFVFLGYLYFCKIKIAIMGQNNPKKPIFREVDAVRLVKLAANPTSRREGRMGNYSRDAGLWLAAADSPDCSPRRPP